MEYRWVQTVFREGRIESGLIPGSGEKDTLAGRGISCPDHGQENQAVNLHPDFRYQTFEGFGGSLTEAAAYTWHTMPQKRREEFMEACFGESGLGYTQARMAIDSCDACLGNYAALEDEKDREMKSFSIGRDEQYILPFWKAAQKAAGEPIWVMMSPWSPPAFMKTNGDKNHGGRLREEYKGMWADYLCRFLESYRQKGVALKRISVQNEPAAVQIWDSCVYSAEEEKAFLKDHLYPALCAHGLADLEIYIWDHNKERLLERAMRTIDGDTDKMITGMAFHWYSGDHFEALQMAHEKFPDKKLLFSEGCVEYSKFAGKDQLADARMYGHDITGDLNHGACAFIDWCILLNEKGGPNHVDNFVDAPIMYDKEKDRMEKKLSYYYIGHFSRAIVPGSVRIGFSRYTDKLDVTAFLRPDGQVAVVLMNRTAKRLPVYLRIQGEILPVTVEGDAIMSVWIEGKKET